MVGKKNGFNKVYTLDKNLLIFEGNYSNRKKNGKGTEYYLNGKRKFQGEYLNGKELKGI